MPLRNPCMKKRKYRDPQMFQNPRIGGHIPSSTRRRFFILCSSFSLDVYIPPISRSRHLQKINQRPERYPWRIISVISSAISNVSPARTLISSPWIEITRTLQTCMNFAISGFYTTTLLSKKRTTSSRRASISSSVIDASIKELSLSTTRMHNRRNCSSLPKRLVVPTSLSFSTL